MCSSFLSKEISRQEKIEQGPLKFFVINIFTAAPNSQALFFAVKENKGQIPSSYTKRKKNESHCTSVQTKRQIHIINF
jgi:hypothetical protein